MNAANKMLNRRGASTHPGGIPSSTANQAPPIVGRVEKEIRTKTRPIVKAEKVSNVPGTALRTTGPVPVDSRQ